LGAIGYNISHVGPYDFKGRYLDTVEQLMQTQEMAAQASVMQTREAAAQAPQIAQVAGIAQVNGTNVSEPATVVAEPPSQLTEPQQGGYDQIVGGTTEWPSQGVVPVELVIEESVKRKRGRPKKALEADGPEKRKRGRPRKSFPQAEAAE